MEWSEAEPWVDGPLRTRPEGAAQVATVCAALSAIPPMSSKGRIGRNWCRGPENNETGKSEPQRTQRKIWA